MSSHGVPHEAHDTEDTIGKKVGLLAALLAIGLTMVTIASHRTHTHGIVARSEANDKWAYFQAKRIKFHTVELGIDLLSAQGLKGEVAEKLLVKYGGEKERLKTDADKIMKEAEEKEAESKHAEIKALRFDFAEGLFEIGLVMSSLYFLSRKKLFPGIGFLAGAAGVILGVVGVFV
jgi:hypothetical protein